MPENTKSKIFEVWTYVPNNNLNEGQEYILRVGEININILGSVFKTSSGFSYKVIGGANNAISGINYKDDEYDIDIEAGDGWHQFVFDYTLNIYKT